VSLLNLTWHQYELLIHFFRKTWHAATSHWGPIDLYWPGELDIHHHIPALLPSLDSVKTLWNVTFQQTVKMNRLEIPGYHAVEWLITDIIEYVCSNAILFALFEFHHELEVLLKLDAFPVAAGHCLILSVTFGNFGRLCKTCCLHFIAAVADCNDKEDRIMHQVLANNFAIIDRLAEAKKIFITALSCYLPIRFTFTGDDVALRLVTGLCSSASNFCCFYCFFRRHLQENEVQLLKKRTLETALYYGAQSQHGHVEPPWLKKILWTDYKLCILHALISMGRMFVHWLHDFLAWYHKETQQPEVWEIAQAWLKELHVNITISVIPTTGTWNVKGKESK
jgi:hypothetical protein